MGGRKSVRGTTPRRLRAKGKGWAQSAASGFVREADKLVRDVRQGRVEKSKADITPGFGTYHPQDLKSLGVLDDPRPIQNARPLDNANYSKQDLGISDQEVELSIREDRPPRRGY